MNRKNNQPIVSYVIPTLNRPESIVELSYQLLGQNYPNYEIVVVDQSAVTNRAMWRMTDQYKKKLRYYTLKKTGTTGARNVGIAKSRGEIIIFLDDDCRVDGDDFTTQHVSNYTDSKIGGVGGRIVDENVKLNRQQSGKVCWVTKTGKIYANASATERVNINAPRGGNMSFRRSVIRVAGGFDERFSGNAMREETDFSLRVVKKGYFITFDPQAEAVHLGLPFGGSRDETKQEWYYHFFHNEMLFFLKHFPKIYLPILLIRKIRPALACTFYYGKGRPMAWLTPARGFIQGIKSYLKKA
ncbi:glycosyltransferase family 2 protein [Patescibacteria group bacterium]